MMYLVAEFLHMVIAAFLIVILFLGGWHFWGLTGSGDVVTWPVAVLRVIVLLAKVMGVILFFMLARWSWPRFRYDQLMDIGLEGDDSLGAGEPGGGGRVDGVRRCRWHAGRDFRPSWGMAAAGWSALVAVLARGDA